MIKTILFLGVKVTCKGPPGHGSRFVEGTVGEKMVSAILKDAVCMNGGKSY